MMMRSKNRGLAVASMHWPNQGLSGTMWTHGVSTLALLDASCGPGFVHAGVCLVLVMRIGSNRGGLWLDRTCSGARLRRGWCRLGLQSGWGWDT
jgi:hypothetical protein